MTAGYQVESTELHDAAKRISDAVAGMATCDVRSVDEIGPSCGDDAVAAAVREFGTRWDEAVRAMSQYATSLGESLVCSATDYTDTDDSQRQCLAAIGSALASGETS